MEEQNAPIFTQAKLEYTNQLIDTLTPHFFDGIKLQLLPLYQCPPNF